MYGRGLTGAIALLAILALLIGPGAALAKKGGKPGKPPPEPEPDPDPAIIYTATVKAGKGTYHLPAVMNADGTNQTLLPIEGWGFNWSADGTRVVFYAKDENEDPGLYVANLDGTGMVRLADGAPYILNTLTSPDWSPGPVKLTPEGEARERIAFAVSDPNARYREDDLYLVCPDGTELTRLTTTPTLNEMDPTWSPSGTRLAFKVEDSARLAVRDLWGLYDIIENLSLGTYDVLQHQGDLAGRFVNSPCWARTQEDKILWTAWDVDQYDVWLLDLDAPESPVQLTSTDRQEWWPCWSPDDTEIAVSKDYRAGPGKWRPSVEIMNADGSNPRIIAEHAYRPRWKRTASSSAASAETADGPTTRTTESWAGSPDSAEGTGGDAGGTSAESSGSGGASSSSSSTSGGSSGVTGGSPGGLSGTVGEQAGDTEGGTKPKGSGNQGNDSKIEGDLGGGGGK